MVYSGCKITGDQSVCLCGACYKTYHAVVKEWDQQPGEEWEENEEEDDDPNYSPPDGKPKPAEAGTRWGREACHADGGYEQQQRQAVRYEKYGPPHKPPIYKRKLGAPICKGAGHKFRAVTSSGSK